MKLSEAIRLGSMWKPQAFDGYSTDGTCALRAGFDALGMTAMVCTVGDKLVNTINYPALIRRFPMLNLVEKHPQWCTEHTVIVIVFTLNDLCRWSRTRIADWLETIEAKYDQQQEAVLSQPDTEETVTP